MQSFKLLDISQARSISDNDRTIGGKLRYGIVATFRKRFCPVSDNLPTLKQVLDKPM